MAQLGNTVINGALRVNNDAAITNATKMNGTLIVSATNAKVSSYDEGIRLNVGKNGYATFLVGGAADSESGTSAGAFWIGTNPGNAGLKRKLCIAQNGSTTTTTYFGCDADGTVSPYLNLGVSGSVASGDTKAVTGGTVYNKIGYGVYAFSDTASTTNRTGCWMAMCNTSQGTSGATTLPTSGYWWHVLNFNCWAGGPTDWTSQLAVCTRHDIKGVWWRCNDASNTNINSSTWHRLAEGDASGNANNALKVNNLTVQTAVPANALFTDHTYNFSGTTFTSGNKDTATHNCNDVTGNGVFYYNSNGPTTSIGASTTDGALYSQAHSTNWVGQIAQDYRNGKLFVRGKNNGTWQSWIKIFDTEGGTITGDTSITGAKFVHGSSCTASGTCAHALGLGTSAGGNYSHTEGYATSAYTNYGHAEGISSYAAGQATHVEGNACTATGGNTHAEGDRTFAKINAGHSEGQLTKATGNYSHAEGSSTTASGDGAHAEGSSTSAHGSRAHAEGYSTTANGTYSHSEGSSSRASGSYSHAEGNQCVASSDGTHAEGQYTSATAGSAHASGYSTSANNHSSAAIGHYNAAMTAGGSATNTTGTAFVIGNGTASTARKNAFSVQYNGVVKAASTITASTTADYAEYFEWSDENPQEEDRVGYFVTFDDEDKIRFATSEDDYILGITSGEPFVLGNGDCDVWNGMVMRDDFRRVIYEPAPEYEEVEGGNQIPKLDKDGKQVYKGTRPVLNPDYDPSIPYISRADRPEWIPVGMLGVLAVRDDGTCQVNGYAMINDRAIATRFTTGNQNKYRVIKRKSQNVIEVIFR